MINIVKQEFEKIMGREVTEEQYNAIEYLYLQTKFNVSKEEFIQSLKPVVSLLHQPEPEPESEPAHQPEPKPKIIILQVVLCTPQENTHPIPPNASNRIKNYE